MDELRQEPIARFDDDEYEEQCQLSSVWTASRLLVLSSIFLYGALLFTYFYLRALNQNGLWRVGHQHPSTLLGTCVAVLAVAAGLVHYVGAHRLQYGARVDWLVSAMTSLTMILAAAGLQIWEMTRLPFQPASSAYAGVFITTAPVYIIYLLAQAYWIETLIAQAMARPESVLVDSGEGMIIGPRFGAKVEGYVLFSEFMIVASAGIWVLFYIL